MALTVVAVAIPRITMPAVLTGVVVNRNEVGFGLLPIGKDRVGSQHNGWHPNDRYLPDDRDRRTG